MTHCTQLLQQRKAIVAIEFLSVIHKLFNLSGEICIFEDKSARRMGYMTQSTILPVTSPNVHQS